MAKKTRTELSTLAINTNLPDNTTELITPTTERAQLTDERESVVNYKDDLGGVSNAGKFITVATDGESLTMVDEPTGELSGSGVSLQVALWDGTKVLTGEAEFIYTAGRLELNKIEIKGVSPKLSINASTSGDPILDFQDSGNTKAELFYDTVFGDEKFVIRAYGVDTVFERAAGTPTLTIDGTTGAATFSAGVNVNGSTLGGTLSVTGDDSVYAAIFKGGTTVSSSYGPYIRAGSDSSDIAFQVRDVTEADLFFRIRGDGSVLIPNGVVFNNNSVTGDKTSVTLNAYEEGTWTPTLASSVGSLGSSYSSSGTYTRIGRWIELAVDFTFTSTGTGGGVLYITNAPFISNTNTASGSGVIPILGTSLNVWWYTGTTNIGMYTYSGSFAGSTYNTRLQIGYETT